MGALQATTLLIRDKCDILIHINVNVEKTVPAYDLSLIHILYSTLFARMALSSLIGT